DRDLDNLRPTTRYGRTLPTWRHAYPSNPYRSARGRHRAESNRHAPQAITDTKPGCEERIRSARPRQVCRARRQDESPRRNDWTTLAPIICRPRADRLATCPPPETAYCTIAERSSDPDRPRPRSHRRSDRSAPRSRDADFLRTQNAPLRRQHPYGKTRPTDATTSL